MKYFVANWKANKNFAEALAWIDRFVVNVKKDAKLLGKLDKNTVKIIIAPPFPLIFAVRGQIEKLKNTYLSAQDVSQYERGAYTGEVTAKTLQRLVTFVIIGHSERRSNFQESDGVILNKVNNAKKYNIEPILCIRNAQDAIPKNVDIIAYEPVYAIGTGNNESPEKVFEMKKKLEISADKSFLYGGSANQKNVSLYLRTSYIDGFLVGGASLDPLHFYNIVRQA